MKKIIVLVMVIALFASMAVTAHAATPTMKVPNLPKIPNISGSVEVKLSDDFWDNWFREHPLNLDFSAVKFRK